MSTQDVPKGRVDGRFSHSCTRSCDIDQAIHSQNTHGPIGGARMPSQPKGESSASLSGRAIITIIGSDRVGIIAGIASVIAEANVNILDISQSVIREFFTMIMMVDLSGATLTFDELNALLAGKAGELAVRVEMQREEIFKTMHRI
ncbi:MAG TPA: ACT domain-containing protein [Xanthobacteraceae bacterium]|jgi:ACT domain-containing protein|nr:ACT domain-containing protein [Xanthobacteraceae bacterium]